MKNYKGDNMKKLLILSTLTLCTLGGLININANHDNDLKESTTDYFNEKSGIKKLTIQEIDNKQSTFNASKIYVQTGNDNEGNEYLRFATALRGNFSNVKYTRTMVGKDDRSAIVETVYKGISTTNNGETISSYSNGESLFNYDITSTKDYYWACYTIKYTAESTFKDTDITINLNVDDKYYDTRTISLNDAKTTTAINTNNVQNCFLNKTLDFDVKTLNFGENKTISGYIQGLTTDGNVLYLSITDQSNSSATIMRYNPLTQKAPTTIKSNINLKTTSSNISDGGFIKYYNNKIFIVSNNGIIQSLDLQTNEIEAVTFSGLETNQTIKDIGYNEVLNQYFALVDTVTTTTTKNEDGTDKVTTNHSYTIKFFNQDKYLLNKSFNVKSWYWIEEAKASLNVKKIQATNEYIYALYYSNEQKRIAVRMYDYSGNMVKEFFIGSDNIFAGTTSNFNVNNLVIFNNKFYVSSIHWNPNYGGLDELTFKNEIINLTTDFVYNTEKSSLGEYVEINKNKGKVNTFDGYRYTTKKYSGLVQGVVTHGDYVYYSYTNDSTNKVTTIVRSNPLTNDWKAGASTINLGRDNIASDSEKYDDAGRILFYNDQLWVVKYKSKELIGVDKDALVANGKPLTFDKLGTNIKDVKFNEFNNMFVIYGTDNYIYYFDTNLNLIEKTSIKVDGTTIHVDDNYIYVSNKTTAQKYLTTTIYSYSGEKISSLINIGSDKIGDTTTNPTKNYNIQAFTEYKGMLILVGLGWEGSMDGGQIYYLNKK